MPDYQVRTDVYNGPMDLLLYLIRRNEVDLYDIPVSEITRQYIEYVELLSAIDPNVAGDFLVMVATLMELKSRMLLPRPVAESGEEEDLSDPRLELVRQLLEYKKFKDASFELTAAADLQAAKWPRVPAKLAPTSPGEVELEDAQIWDLVAAFNRMMSSIGVRPAMHEVVFDDTPIALHAVDIVDRLQRDNGEMAFEAIFAGRTKSEMIGLFLALLELMRQQRVRIVQEQQFGTIRIILLSAEPITVDEGATAAIRDAASGEGETMADEETAQAQGDRAEDDQSPEAREEEDDEEDAAVFADLDQIKTDIDIDAVLRTDSTHVAGEEEQRE